VFVLSIFNDTRPFAFLMQRTVDDGKYEN
jgi:hypothetical protein